MIITLLLLASLGSLSFPMMHAAREGRAREVVALALAGVIGIAGGVYLQGAGGSVAMVLVGLWLLMAFWVLTRVARVYLTARSDTNGEWEG